MGVGTGVRKLTVSHLSEALIAATTDSKQLDRAKFIGEQIRGVSIRLKILSLLCSLYTQEDGVATAVESIYRDLEYARSLIKQHHDTHDLGDISEVDGEDSTIRNRDNMSPSSLSGDSSGGSVRGAPSEDWSIISEQDGGGSRGDGVRASLISAGPIISTDSAESPVPC